MTEPVFFRPACKPTIADIVSWTGAEVAPEADQSIAVSNVAPLDQGVPGDLVFLDNAKYAETLGSTRASLCLLSKRYAERLPAGTIGLFTNEPYRAFGIVLQKMYPDANRPSRCSERAGSLPEPSCIRRRGLSRM